QPLRRLVVWTVLALPVAIAAELVIVWFKLAGTSIVGGLTGWFSLLRLVGLVVIWAIAVAWWRRGRRGVGTPGPLTVLAVTGWAATSVMAQVAMTRFLSPQYDIETSMGQIFLGFDLPD